MQIPVRVSFHGTPVSDEVEAFCLREAEKLEDYFGRITGCRITVERSSHHHREGDHWRIVIRMTVPGREIVVSRDPPAHEADVRIDLALREAFDRARRRLEDHVRRADFRVKHHEPAEEGRVARLDGLNGFGFIEAADGSEVYFHRNALVQGSFEDLAVGSKVHFASEVGEKGPQATTVRAHGH